MVVRQEAINNYLMQIAQHEEYLGRLGITSLPEIETAKATLSNTALSVVEMQNQAREDVSKIEPALISVAKSNLQAAIQEAIDAGGDPSVGDLLEATQLLANEDAALEQLINIRDALLIGGNPP